MTSQHHISSSVFLCMALWMTLSLARPYKDSPVQTIIVPYQRTAISGHPYQFPKMMSGTRRVLVPTAADLAPNFNLKPNVMTMMAVGGAPRGRRINFVDGAYPVYYMPSNVNGMFNGKISLLS